MIVRAAHFECVRAFEPEHYPVLIVDAHRVQTAEVPGERVQPIPWWHLQIIELGYGVDLIQFSADDGPHAA